MKYISLLISPLLFIALIGCSGKSTDKPMAAGPEDIVNDAMTAFNSGRYITALKHFEILTDRFPFSQYSLMAELKSADCQYYEHNYQEAIAAYQAFEENHPTNEAVPYTMFQVGMSYYNQLDSVDRDPASAVDAIAVFTKLIRSYPLSSYVDEARSRVIAARNFLANHEMYVARFYIKTNKLKQAEVRLQYLLDNFPDSSVTAEAERVLAILKSGKKPRGSWKDWIPELGMPDWETFTSFKQGG
ncbi:MAG: outer membrane protein assembly factor BamD [Thermodesulfobacteriota bacterium]